MADLKQKTVAHFDEKADDYDSSSEFEHPRQLHEHVLSAIAKLPFKHLLDVGCGTGMMLDILAQAHPDAALFGIDISTNMLRQAEKRLLGKATLTLGDAENLPYPDQQFDLVTCVESFHHYTAPEKAVSEFSRVLSPAGSLLLCDMRPPSFLRPIINFTMPRFSKGGDVHAYSEKEIRRFFEKNGLATVSWYRTPAHAFICIASKE